MSSDFKMFLRYAGLFAVAVAIATGLYAGYRAHINHRHRLAQEYERDQRQRFDERGREAEAQQERNALQRRASAAKKPPARPPQNSSELRVHISSPSFSPDGRFVAAVAHYSTVSHIVIWPASGGPTLYREPNDLGDTWGPIWAGKDTLRGDGRLWRLHKSEGFWQLEKEKQLDAFAIPGRLNGGSVKDFPKYDLRILQISVRPDSGEMPNVWSALEAYSLSTGDKLPIPPQLRAGPNLKNVTPVARWGKAPLRIALWVDFDVPSPQGPVSKSRIELWNCREAKQIWRKTYDSSSGDLLVGREGKFLSALAAGRIEVLDTQTGRVLATRSTEDFGYQSSSSISEDGELLVYTTRQQKRPEKVRVLDAKTLRELKTFTVKESGSKNSQTAITQRELTFSRDNRWIAVTDRRGIRLYDWRRTNQSGQAPSKQLWL